MQLVNHSKVTYCKYNWEVWKQNTKTFFLRRYDNVLRSVIKEKCPKNSHYLEEYRAKKGESLI